MTDDSVKALAKALDLAHNQQLIEDRVKAFLQVMMDPEWEFYDRAALTGVEFVSATPGRVEYAFTVTKDKCNGTSNLHGGCAATMLDDLTSSANLTLPIGGDFGSTVSRTLSCTYLRGLPLGERCTIVCEVVRGGKRLAHFRGEIRGSDGKVAVVCTHDKAVLAPSL